MSAAPHDGSGPAHVETADQETLPISVLMPAYNRAGMLTRALQSIAAQRPRRPAEVIVIDDGSADASAEAAARLGARVIVHERNLGVTAARNTGLQAASQPWIAFLDSDDEWLPEHLETLWSLHEGCVLVASSSINCRDHPARDRVVGPLTRGPSLLRDAGRLIHPINFVTISAAMARRDTMLALGGFLAQDGVEDLDMWVRLVDSGRAMLSPRVTVVYHVHGAQITDDMPQMRAKHMGVALAHGDRPWAKPALVKRRAGADGWDELRDALDAGRRGLAARHALRIASSPQRMRGVSDLLAWRVRARRASSRVRRDGRPSLAILIPRARRGNVPDRLIEHERADLHRLGPIRTVLCLSRRPAGLAVVDSRAGTMLARALGIPSTRPTDARTGEGAAR